MTTAEKLNKIYSNGWFQIYNTPRHIGGGEWDERILWKHVGMPNQETIKECEWEGFRDIDDCLDDCLKYVDTLIKKE